jgi:hypothetical protein
MLLTVPGAVEASSVATGSDGDDLTRGETIAITASCYDVISGIYVASTAIFRDSCPGKWLQK